MLTKILIAASLTGTLLLTSQPTVAQSLPGIDTPDAYVSGGSGDPFVPNRRCNYRILDASGQLNPNFLTCNITSFLRCRSGILFPGFRACVNLQP